MDLKVIECVYHRNGISGRGFYTVWFSWVEDGIEEEGIATVDADDVELSKKNVPYNPGTRVLVLNEAGGVEIERTMRGDNFHGALVEWIIKEKV